MPLTTGRHTPVPLCPRPPSPAPTTVRRTPSNAQAAKSPPCVLPRASPPPVRRSQDHPPRAAPAPPGGPASSSVAVSRSSFPEQALLLQESPLPPIPRAAPPPHLRPLPQRALSRWLFRVLSPERCRLHYIELLVHAPFGSSNSSSTISTLLATP